MGLGSNLKSDQIAAITALCQAGHSNKEICTITGVSKRSVQRWTKKFRDSLTGEVQLQGKTTGRPRKFGPRTLNITKRQVDLEPSLSTRKLKEMNPDILSHVSMRTLQRRLSVDLEYRRRVARKKPLITERQQRNRMIYAKEKIKWSKRKWRNVLFTDEAIFTGCRLERVTRMLNLLIPYVLPP